ncbi:hypothetical protein Lbir_0554 [Legionella birminghamensis]|uniref:Uncharacterized protein n=1 Tax=Legionella birminghamensis TaxID=28083 RepID=A0A378I9N9_9GAMM|nr:hypothetical protein [Legionella birminghamensis]KTC75180.1 hypothetical protein Lbir_0554 [Legionella birminghamensis]STX31869.1 Uncharacterised protein [Legionella birminghamensis]
MPIFTWGTLHEIGVVLSGWELNNLIKLNITLGSHFLNLENRLDSAEEEIRRIRKGSSQLTPANTARLVQLQQEIIKINQEKQRCIPEHNLISRIIETKQKQEKHWAELSQQPNSRDNPNPVG